MIFFSKKTKTTTIPSGWPSPYHNKCSQRDCTFPNSPQTVKGVYPCRGVPGGFYCEGTYKVSSSRAQETERYLREVTAARRAAEEEQRNRTISGLRRPDLTTPRQGTDAPTTHYVALDGRRHPSSTHSSRPSQSSDGSRASRPSDVGPRPPAVDDRRHPESRHGPHPGHSGHGSRAHRPSDVGQRPPQLPPLRHASHATHRPSSSQVKAEYITDQIMMHLYPERHIQPRWI